MVLSLPGRGRSNHAIIQFRCVEIRSSTYNRSMSTPEDLTKAWIRAENAMRQRRYDAAAVLWEVYMTLDPSDVNARVNRVFSLLNSGQSEGALDEARSAHNQQPDSEATAMTLLEGLDNNDLTGELKSKAEEFTETFPNLPTPWFHVGKALFHDGRYEEARGFARKAVELKNTYCVAWLLIGECSNRLSRYEEALAAFEQGLGTFQSYPSPQQAKFDSLVGMGRALAFLDRPGRALILAEQAEEMNVNAAEAQGLKARCKFRFGECKMKATQFVTHSEISKLVQRMDLAAETESEDEKREVEGYFFTTTDYDEDAKELAREHGITMYRARISGNPQKSSEWRISRLEEID